MSHPWPSAGSSCRRSELFTPHLCTGRCQGLCCGLDAAPPAPVPLRKRKVSGTTSSSPPLPQLGGREQRWRYPAESPPDKLINNGLSSRGDRNCSAEEPGRKEARLFISSCALASERTCLFFLLSWPISPSQNLEEK